jgi:demethylmenaquinone methyltransferase/2-methoxy-6-polyprenyl-1,4-benzoquinol methylase
LTCTFNTPATDAGKVRGWPAIIQICRRIKGFIFVEIILVPFRWNCGGISFEQYEFQKGSMSQLSGDERARYVRTIFSRIASRYDLMNRLMTGGQDVHWRKEAIAMLNLMPGERLLDLGAGTGDLAREGLRRQPGLYVVAADFTMEMMRAGRQDIALDWSAADALRLPFPNSTFDAIVSGFLMRNVGNLSVALQEQFRVLKTSGRIVILETTRPRRNPMYPFIWFYMHLVIPLLGALVSGFREAYTYLPDSTHVFLQPDDLVKRMEDAGFKNVRYRYMMFKTLAIHYGEGDV